MKLDLKDLIPKTSDIEIKGKKYELDKPSLLFYIWIENEFGTDNESGISVLERNLSKLNLDTITKVAYRLLKDKSDFPTIDVFTNSFGQSINILEKALPAMLKTFTDNQPNEDETKEYSDLKKSKAVKV